MDLPRPALELRALGVGQLGEHVVDHQAGRLSLAADRPSARTA